MTGNKLLKVPEIEVEWVRGWEFGVQNKNTHTHKQNHLQTTQQVYGLGCDKMFLCARSS